MQKHNQNPQYSQSTTYIPNDGNVSKPIPAYRYQSFLTIVEFEMFTPELSHRKIYITRKDQASIGKPMYKYITGSLKVTSIIILATSEVDGDFIHQLKHTECQNFMF